MAKFPPEGFALELLSRVHPRRRFSTGDERVDTWLTRKALGAIEKHTNTTQVLVDHDGRIAGYYTLASTALDDPKPDQPRLRGARVHGARYA